MAQRCGYPLHLGVTEAGTARMGLIKSAIGIGSLLQQGIGDTLRVSLTADPVEEIAAGKDILKALGMGAGPPAGCPAPPAAAPASTSSAWPAGWRRPSGAARRTSPWR